MPSRKPCPLCPLVASPATGSNAPTQTELPRRHAAIQAPGCRVYLSDLPVSEGSSEHSCGRRAQVEGLLRLVTELWEEVGRLRSIRQLEEEISWWNRPVPSLKQTFQPATRNKGSPTHLPPGNRREPGRQGNGSNLLLRATGRPPLPASLIFPGALTPAWGSGTGWTGKW